METFTERLEWIVKRLAQGKATVFARKVGIPAGTFHRYISGGGMPRVEHLISISEFSGASIDWLLKGDTPPAIAEPEEVHETNPQYPITRPEGPAGELISLVNEIMESDDEGTKLALTQNVHMFHEKIKEKRTLLRRIDALEKALRPYVPSGKEAKEE